MLVPFKLRPDPPQQRIILQLHTKAAARQLMRQRIQKRFSLGCMNISVDGRSIVREAG